MNELNIHIRLKEARKYLNLNQLKVAADLGIKQKTVSEIENGKIMNIPNTYIYYFYKKGISLEWIYTGKAAMLTSGYSKSEENEIDDFQNNDNLLFKNKNFSDKKLMKSAASDLFDLLPELNFKLLLNSKDENIQHLINYIHSQEKIILFLQEIIRKELKLN